MQTLTLVIGYGNPLCGDDGAGPLVVQRLAGEFSSTDDRRAVQCLAVFQLTPELAEIVSEAAAVLFVDAARGGPPGAVQCRELRPAQSSLSQNAPAFTHHVNPVALLASAAHLYGRCPAAYLCTITGRNFEIGEPLSAEVVSALPTLSAAIRARIALCTSSA
jgi:hydrogenase maturation protease